MRPSCRKQSIVGSNVVGYNLVGYSYYELCGIGGLSILVWAVKKSVHSISNHGEWPMCVSMYQFVISSSIDDECDERLVHILALLCDSSFIYLRVSMLFL